MNRSQSRMYKMIERFEENLNNMPINEYFQVPMEIKINHEDILNITCRFIKHPIFIKFNIPIELNCIILSYASEYSYAKYQIIVPNDYPFKPPFWVLINSDEKNKEKYKKSEINQNVRYRNSWEPSISFEKDILYMIESIYYFNP